MSFSFMFFTRIVNRPGFFSTILCWASIIDQYDIWAIKVIFNEIKFDTMLLICISLLMRTLQIYNEQRQIYRTGSMVTFISGILILSLGFSNLGTIPLIPVLYRLRIWTKTANEGL
jgi:hypothetical protein